jgi:hypothetical protein
MTPPFPSSDEISEVADWVELMVLLSEKPYKRGSLVTTLEREDAHVNSADVFDELERREALMGELWPLDLDDDEAVLSLREGAAHRTLYTFLAALGLRQNITHDGRVLFEECVSELSSAITGHAAIRIGHPRKAPVPQSLREAIERYCVDSREQEGKFKPPEAADKDLGMDVANWWPFKDGRGGYVHLIGQCATGADWDEKLPELAPRLWEEHIHWAVPPVRFFATPMVVSHEDFRRSSILGGLMLDRPRLIELAQRAGLSDETRDRIEDYTLTLYD